MAPAGFAPRNRAGKENSSSPWLSVLSDAVQIVSVETLANRRERGPSQMTASQEPTAGYLGGSVFTPMSSSESKEEVTVDECLSRRRTLEKTPCLIPGSWAPGVRLQGAIINSLKSSRCPAGSKMPDSL